MPLHRSDSGPRPGRLHSISRVSAAARLDPAGLRTRLGSFQARPVAAREDLFHQEDEARFIYYVLSGQFRVSSSTEGGHEIDFATARTGDLLGLEAICRRRYKVTARTTRKARVIQVSRDDFLGLLAGDGKLATSVLSFVLMSLGDSQDRLLNICGRPAVQRLAHFILQQISGDENRMGLPWGRRTQIAAELSIKQETLSRLLNQLETLGVARSTRNELIVLDREKLHDLAE